MSAFAQAYRTVYILAIFVHNTSIAAAFGHVGMKKHNSSIALFVYNSHVHNDIKGSVSVWSASTAYSLHGIVVRSEFKCFEN